MNICDNSFYNSIELYISAFDRRSKKFSKEPLRVFTDFYPEDLQKINWIIDVIRDIADIYSYEEYSGPLLEPIEIFAVKSSEELVNEQSFYVKMN